MRHSPQIQCKSHISTNGRLNIPAMFRKAMNLKDGDEVLLTLKDNNIEVKPVHQLVTELQNIVSQYYGKEDLLENLNSLRRSDAKREAQKLNIK